MAQNVKRKAVGGDGREYNQNHLGQGMRRRCCRTCPIILKVGLAGAVLSVINGVCL